MCAYYNYINGKKHRAYNYLDKARAFAKQKSHLVLQFWVEHTRDVSFFLSLTETSRSLCSIVFDFFSNDRYFVGRPDDAWGEAYVFF